MKNHDRRRTAGFTLIEVLVAVLIFSFGLLGFIGLQARATQYATSAEDSGRAALLANEIATTIVAKGNGAASVPASDYSAWQTRVSTPTSGGLPNGTGSVSTSGNTATITLTWKATAVSSTAANVQNRYTTQVIVP